MHEARSDAEEELHALLREDVVVDAQAPGLLHDGLLLHVGLDEPDELVVEDVLVL